VSKVQLSFFILILNDSPSFKWVTSLA
jgi:hypothetical protein